jgi:hypothetical protein
MEMRRIRELRSEIRGIWIIVLYRDWQGSDDQGSSVEQWQEPGFVVIA